MGCARLEGAEGRGELHTCQTSPAGITVPNFGVSLESLCCAALDVGVAFGVTQGGLISRGGRTLFWWKEKTGSVNRKRTRKMRDNPG